MYEKGQLKMELSEDGKTFTLTGNMAPKDHDTDHSQLIYEALEIAGNGKDPFHQNFAAMAEEYVELTENWYDLAAERRGPTEDDPHDEAA